MESNRRPINFLTKNLNNTVVVRLKNDLEYVGRMVQCDNYMNMILEGATEYRSETPIANYGNIFIRGNNIVYICLDRGK